MYFIRTEHLQNLEKIKQLVGSAPRCVSLWADNQPYVDVNTTILHLTVSEDGRYNKHVHSVTTDRCQCFVQEMCTPNFQMGLSFRNCSGKKSHIDIPRNAIVSFENNSVTIECFYSDTWPHQEIGDMDVVKIIQITCNESA